MSNCFTRYNNDPRKDFFGDMMPYILVGMTLLILLFSLARFARKASGTMIRLRGGHERFLYIHTGSGFAAVRDSLVKPGILADREAFEWLSRRKHYVNQVRPGRYRLTDGMSNNELVNLLRSGRQEPVRVAIRSIRTRGELAGLIGKHLETDSARLARLFDDPYSLSRYGTSPLDLFTLFIPDTYEFYWNTSADQLMKRMTRESGRFWTPLRRRQAGSLHLTIPQVVTLASIVEKESNKNDEKPVIAGVYLNRLKKGVPLQADPTVIFAWNDYTIRRVLKKHTELKSPYNTYLNTGLPPGPICLPSVASIEGVLHAANHSYMYFCAREDFSGYHNFAVTLAEHTRNAKKYQKALDTNKIK